MSGRPLRLIPIDSIARDVIELLPGHCGPVSASRKHTPYRASEFLG